MTRPRLLDLYCGAGGCGVGYYRAGWEVVGVDAASMPRYPYEFHRADALDFLTRHGHEFDAVHASPPCQSESSLRHRTGVAYVDMLTPTIDAFADLSVPWVIENVASTDKLPGSIVLCGVTFGLHATASTGETRWLRRHRRFSSNVALRAAGPCACAGRLIGGVYGDGGGGQQTRGWRYESAQQMREAMGINWMSRVEMSQAIPPAYTHHIGSQLIGAREAAA